MFWFETLRSSVHWKHVRFFCITLWPICGSIVRMSRARRRSGSSRVSRRITTMIQRRTERSATTGWRHSMTTSYPQLPSFSFPPWTCLPNTTRNSSGDEIANVNFPNDDIVNALQNTIDSCMNSAIDRRGYVLEHRFTKFSEITQCNSYYAVQGH